eukprot:CAMPEP_0184324282 /NCGR_PEP_ID=MMETSP1049-20130417/134426_1 /TAXON_ID=77928 /ORGANISM="Proteomonas sulcata, Strain CCMP704" /LENGTH=62 /DNA_ID=CAMNT_0026646007 /DNA_START=121 /DNA_END=309 /DNA_ORIENTATION=+
MKVMLQEEGADAADAGPTGPTSTEMATSACKGFDAIQGLCAAVASKELDEDPKNWIGGFEQG